MAYVKATRGKSQQPYSNHYECYSIKRVDRAHTECVLPDNAVGHEAQSACQFAREFDLRLIRIAIEFTM